MATLLLRLAAPMQSWGTDSKFETRRTAREPSKSGVIGMLAAALGLRRDQSEELTRLNQLRFGVRVDQEGTLLVDFHTVHTEDTSYLTYRHYMADAVYLVGFESDDDSFLESLRDALCHPVFPLFLGRRSCPPTMPLCLGIRQGELLETLQTEPLQGGDKPVRTCRIVCDADPQQEGGVPVHDLPITFDPTHRQYGYRAVRQIYCQPPVPAKTTEHDPFAEL